MAWYDFYKLFTYSFEQDPNSKKATGNGLTGAGVTQPDVIPNIRQDGSYWGGNDKGVIRLRDTNDFIDLSTVSNRQSRYKEYERLRNIPEIESVLTVISDEACFSKDTKVQTTAYGTRTIDWILKNIKDNEFTVYCWDFKKHDYTIGWAYSPRFVKHALTIRISFDDGTHITCTPDHRILLSNEQWCEARNLKVGNELMAFYRKDPDKNSNPIKFKQFPRILTKSKGWVHERQFLDEWRTGKPNPELERFNSYCKYMSAGIKGKKFREIFKITDWDTVKKTLNREGFTTLELHKLGKLSNTRRVINISVNDYIATYDLSVKEHENFCSESVVLHNCQIGENDHSFQISVKNEEVKKEIEWLLFNEDTINSDKRVWSDFKNLCINGDLFYELIIDPDNPKDGIYKIQMLPADSMFRIETTKGKLIEFQQSKEGPDYESLAKTPVVSATDAEIQQTRALRFAPNQIVHIKIGDDRRTFYPYGVSLIETARGPAHQLRLMEDAMLVYRLTRAPERRVFYIDIGMFAPHRAEAMIERLKDQFRKKKVTSQRPATGANSVEERWQPPAADEDFFIPIRQNSQTRVDTLPGAQNLGEIDDAVYFRNKLFTALNFPKNYFNNEDAQATRLSLSAQDIKFARMIERMQSHYEDGIKQIVKRHLFLRGYPSESYEDLKIKMTPPSHWKEISEAEVITNRINNAGSLKGSQLMSDYDIYRMYFKFTENETKEMLSRLKIQKLEEMKLQIIAQNPQLAGIGVPSNDDKAKEMGTETGGPNPMLTPDQGAEPEGQSETQPGSQPPETEQISQKNTTQTIHIPNATREDIKKYDLEIQGYSQEQDREEQDFSEI